MVGPLVRLFPLAIPHLCKSWGTQLTESPNLDPTEMAYRRTGEALGVSLPKTPLPKETVTFRGFDPRKVTKIGRHDEKCYSSKYWLGAEERRTQKVPIFHPHGLKLTLWGPRSLRAVSAVGQ